MSAYTDAALNGHLAANSQPAPANATPTNAAPTSPLHTGVAAAGVAADVAPIGTAATDSVTGTVVPNGVRAEPAPPGWMQDVLPKPRDAQANTLSRAYAYDVPTVDDVPLAQTPWARLVALVEQCDATAALNLHAFYDHKLRPSIKRILGVRGEEEEAVAQCNRLATAHNEQVDARLQQLKGECDAALQAEDAALLVQDEPLRQAHREAAHRVALAGGFYDPQRPDPDCVLRHTPASLEALAAELRLPWTPDDDKARLPKCWAYALTVGTGLLLGVSLGLLGHFFTPDLLLRKWLLVLLFAGVGAVIALCVGESLKLSFKAVGERYWLGLPASNWAPLLVGALGFAAALLVMDSYVEQQGLMALVRQEDAIHALSRHAAAGGTSSLLYFLAGMILSLPYLSMNAWHGYLVGRHQTCLNRLIEERDRRFGAADTGTRRQPVVQQALAALSQVHDALRARQTIAARRDATQARFQAEMAQLAAQRLDDKAGLDEAAKARIQDAIKNYHGAQSDWDRLLEGVQHYWVPAQPD